MRPLSKRLKDELSADPYYKKCACADGNCSGRIEWHHVWEYAGRQINEKWAILPLCKFHHDNLDKEFCQFISLMRATLGDLMKYPCKNWIQLKDYLYQKYAKDKI